MSEDIFWTKIRVTYGNGSVVEGDQIDVALISGFTGEQRGGEVKREYLARRDPNGGFHAPDLVWTPQGTPVERLEVIASDIRQRLEDSTTPVTVGFVSDKLWKGNVWQGTHNDMILRTDAKYMGAPLSEVVAYMNWRGI